MYVPNVKKSVATFAVLGCALFAAGAQAVSIDFALIAQQVKNASGATKPSGDEAHWNNGELQGLLGGSFDGGTFVYDATLGYLFEKDGIRVKATALSSTLTSGTTDAYLDGYSGGPGGIGACLTSLDDCGSTDNMAASVGEEVTLTFYDLSNNLLTVALDYSYHTDGDHKTVFSGNSSAEMQLFVDGSVVPSSPFDLNGLPTTNTIGDGKPAVMLALGYTGHSFTFDVLTSELYLSGIDVRPVPLPAAVWLFGSSLVGLGLIGRRRSARPAA